MSGGHRTARIARPTEGGDASDGIERRDDTRLLQRRRSRGVFGLVGFVIVLALAFALFVLPLRTWRQQRIDLDARSKDLAELTAANDRLDAANARLQTAEGIAAAAREDLGYQSADEQSVIALPPADVGRQLPSGWPYDLVSQIIVVRSWTEPAATSSSPAAADTGTTAFPSYHAGG